MTPPVAILLLAAGGSRRMRGADKLLQNVDALPLLRRQALAALNTGVPVIVALPPDNPARHRVLDGLPVQRVTVAEAAEGMGRSLASAAAVPQAGVDLLVLPADMPDIGAAELNALLAARHDHPDTVLRGAASDGTPGHPVLFPARLRGRLTALHGDTGARRLLRNEKVVAVTLPGRAALTDLDTPEDWAAWRAGRSSD